MTHEPHRKKQLEAALLEVLDEAMSVDQAACGKIRVYNADARTLEIQAQRGFSDGFVQTFRAVDADEELACARAFRLRRRVTVPNVTTDPFSAPYLEPSREEGFTAASWARCPRIFRTCTCRPRRPRWCWTTSR
jgi:GAF domain-containing protein